MKTFQQLVKAVGYCEQGNCTVADVDAQLTDVHVRLTEAGVHLAEATPVWPKPSD